MRDLNRGLLLSVILAFLFDMTAGQFNPQQSINPSFGQPPFFQQRPNGPLLYRHDMGNLYNFGRIEGDMKLVDREAQTGYQLDLHTYFPYYGARYNYSILSTNGYITFGDILDNGLDFTVDKSVSWPEDSDPATIAVYMCPQKEAPDHPEEQTGVWYRLVLRSDARARMPHTRRRINSYVVENDELMRKLEMDLKDGMVGAQNFRPHAALIVTWVNMTFAQASEGDVDNARRSTYQAVFMTDAGAQMSYVILNYHTLGYGGSDIDGGSKRGRCHALFNGGNHTGQVQVDDMFIRHADQLAAMSAVPHKVAGRYLFRVDDVVRKGGCSNHSSGTARLTIYPDLVNAMGGVKVQINGPCVTPKDNPTLEMAEAQTSSCKVKNAAIVECKMVRFYQWGTKKVFLKLNQNKAYVGTVYYVPPGLDPLQLEVMDHANSFDKYPRAEHWIKWYPGNFTNAHGEPVSTLRLALYGYKERREGQGTKFLPVLERIALIESNVPNMPSSSAHDMMMHHIEQQATFSFTPENHRRQFTGNAERDFLSYRFGFLKLYEEDITEKEEDTGGLWSPPIPLHWWWGRENIERIAADKCMDWYKEDGNQWNFIMDTETNSSCPCKIEQAEIDVGRYIPHPRCSERLRNLGCDAYVGARDCYLSAQNVQGHYVTHYGQVCCYDRNGLLMQTSYQSVVQVEGHTPYNPGFPQRAYEFGTYPYSKQFEIPVLSNYYHDVMPYFMCCKWVPDRCQFFYWRRPSSGCQNYRPPGVGTVMGAGHFVTFDRLEYTFNEPGTYMLVHKPQIKGGAYYDSHNDYSHPPSPEVQIQVRLERYPNRLIDFSHKSTRQADLVQPLNVSVVTGVAIQEGSEKEFDRVIIVLRKDTRRVKYRLNVIVAEELKYFDVVKTQKYKGVLIYVNDVVEGQAEIYATLDKSRIGVRIRETYGMEIVKHSLFEESLGLLDVLVSIPPEYQLSPDPGRSNFDYEHAVAGLLGSFSGARDGSSQFLDGVSRQPVGISPTDPGNVVRTWQIDGKRYNDLFSIKSDNAETPEAALIQPVYPFAEKWADQSKDLNNKGRSRMVSEQNYQSCRNNPQQQQSSWPCPPRSIVEDISTVCMEMDQCKFDYFELRQSTLGSRVRDNYNQFAEWRDMGTQKFNSCGAINIEYPEHLQIDPPTGRLYLEGDTVHFDCYQEHWVKGQTVFQCKRGGWTKGYQPWCRSKRLENTQKILSIIFGILFFIIVLLAVFMCCFCVRRSRQTSSHRTYRANQPIRHQSTKTKAIQPSAKTEIIPLVQQHQRKTPDAEWKATKDFEPKKQNVPAIESFDASSESSPVVLEKPTTIIKENTYSTPPRLMAKKTWV